MTVNPAEQVFEEILPYLEMLDAQIGGVIQLLKDKGITAEENRHSILTRKPTTTTEEFAKYVERADRGSSQAKRVRGI